MGDQPPHGEETGRTSWVRLGIALIVAFIWGNIADRSETTGEIEWGWFYGRIWFMTMCPLVRDEIAYIRRRRKAAKGVGPGLFPLDPKAI